MAQVELTDYLARVEELLQSGRYDDALAHCRHILAQIPEHAETSRLAGEAYLGQMLLPEAEASFKHTLDVDPENWAAHSSLGRIYGDQGRLREAILELECALELAPGNIDLTQILQRLHTQRDGVAGDPLPLTHAALGRIYALNGLHEQAIGEYRDAQTQHPQRQDVRAGLAEALWREAHRLEAVETSLDLVRALPHCLKANLILGQLYTSSGQEAAAEEWLGVARDLDPQNRLAHELMGAESPLPFTAFSLPELESAPSAEAPPTPLPQVGLLGDLEAAAREPADLVEELPPSQLPDWLQELPPGAAAAASQAGTTAEPAPAPAEPISAETLPDWLQSGQGTAEPQGMPVTPAFPAGPVPLEELPEWLREAQHEPSPGASSITAAQELPMPAADLRAAEPAAEPAAEEAPEQPPESPPEPARPETSDLGVSLPPEAPAPDLPPAGEVPEWVRKMEAVVADQAPPPGLPPLEPVAPVPAGPQVVLHLPELPPEEQAAHRERVGELMLQLQARPGNYRARIELARRCSLGRDWEGALAQYEELLANCKLVPAVVHDLEQLVDKQDVDHVQLYRLLGDGYTDLDQPDRASEMYRLAREALKAQRLR